MATYLRCIKETGSVVLFDGLVAMEFGDEIRVRDDALLRTDVLIAIAALEIADVGPDPTPIAEVPWVLKGSWDAFTLPNYPPPVPGHSYQISDGGQLQDLSLSPQQTETYATGDRILFNLNDQWELIGGGSVVGSYNGTITITDVQPGNGSDVWDRFDDVDGTPLSFDSSGAQVIVTMEANMNEQGEIPTVTFDGNNVTMTPINGGVTGTYTYTMATGTFLAVHESGASDDIDLLVTGPPLILTAEIVDTNSILTPPRTLFTQSDDVQVEFTLDADAQWVEVRNQGAIFSGLGGTQYVPLGAGTGPHFVNAKVRGSVDLSEGGEIRVGTGLETNIDWGIWTATDNVIARDNTKPSMLPGTVTILGGYEYLDFNNQVTFSGFSYPGATHVTPFSDAGLLGGFPTATTPATFENFSAIGIADGVVDLNGNTSLRLHIEDRSNGQSVSGYVQVRYYAVDVTVNIHTGQEDRGGASNYTMISGVDSGIGAENWVLLSTNGPIGLAGPNIIASTITLTPAAGSGYFETPEWRLAEDPEVPNAPGIEVARRFYVKDSDTKGNHQWTGFAALTVSGRPATFNGGAIEYRLAGIEEREYTVGAPFEITPDPLDGRYVDLGVNVVNPFNVDATLNSFSIQSPNYTYSGNSGDVAANVGEFTLLDNFISSGGVPGETVAVSGGELVHGRYWYNKNYSEATKNGSGTAKLSIAEASKLY